MLRPSLRRFIVALLAAVAMAGDAAADTRPPQVVIRIYDGTAAEAATRAMAIQTAAGIVADAGIDAAWYDCTGDERRRECTPSGRGRELIIRIMATPAGIPGADREIDTGAQTGTFRLILGVAVVESSGGVGSLATIFRDRIEALAQRTDVPASAVFGLTMAHEVGHLLLGTRSHGRTGLMREVWTDQELTLGRAKDWQFAPSERHILQSIVREAPPAAPESGPDEVLR